MLIIFWITIVVVVFVLLYPFGLMLMPKPTNNKNPENSNIDAVSLILLTYNGEAYLQHKIPQLLSQLDTFQYSELIIVDDKSNDRTVEILSQFENISNVKIILKKEQKGIPHSMNLAAEQACYNHIVFCDQRQELIKGNLQRIVAPLKNGKVGAVSACISHFDKSHKYSIIRKYENFIKLLESSGGCLIGVYGPLYAIKKDCYHPIPEYIILDDLYLSLRILKSKQVLLLKECSIIDNNFSTLYNYNRAKRYLMGFIQMFFEKGLIWDLSNKQILMLFWHKYLRLFIPVLLFATYLMLGFLMGEGVVYQILFGLLSVLGLLTILQMVVRFPSHLFSMFRMNIYYLGAMVEISIRMMFGNGLIKKNPASANARTKKQ